MISLLEELNPVQKQVVETTEGPVLVLAGAGSGKTRCVIARAGYLMFDKRIAPWNLLIVTFTNKAARELRDRLDALSPGCSQKMWVGTFHSICARILRYESDALPFTSNFSIYDADDQKTLIKKQAKALNIDTDSMSMGAVANLISRCKNNLIQPDGFHEFYRKDALGTNVERIYDAYQKALLANNALDFDDILYYTAYLFDSHPEIRDKYAKQFRYVMIDEYQDTNYAQFKIIHQIAGSHRNICVVGDDDQAIYSWRGASIKNILEFEKDYGKASIFRLEQNYRSTPVILNLANSLIAHNRDRHEKSLWSDRESTIIPRLTPFEHESEEVEGVIKELTRLQRSGVPWSDSVVLFRTNAQSRGFEIGLTHHRIPFVIVGGVGFYQRREIKDIIAYLRFLENPTDNESLHRIINFPPRKLGDTTVSRLLDYALIHHASLWDAVRNADWIETIKAAAKKSLSQFVALIDKWREDATRETVANLIARIVHELDLLDFFRSTKDLQDESRAENIEEFIDAVGEFSEQFALATGHLPMLSEYLPNLSLQTDLDQSAVDQDVVRLMTMHNAKGLEFEHVFITGLNEMVCPHRLCIDSRETLEEERRLLYVAMTRAKTGLYMSYSRWRREKGSYEPANPSRFIADMDRTFFESPKTDFPVFERMIPQPPPASTVKTVNPMRNVTLESAKYYRIGMNVTHKTFGKGIVLNVDGVDKDAVLTISFQGGMLKKIKGGFVEIQS
jgi:DNA helicase-2/ATP-dependent DNA helicase PcrA